jgi:hypothetical protein
MAKQMEGDNLERRRKARGAREAGNSPSAERVTAGSSKQRTHLGDRPDHATKLETPRATKQPLQESRRKPSPYPSRHGSG